MVYQIMNISLDDLKPGVCLKSIGHLYFYKTSIDIKSIKEFRDLFNNFEFLTEMFVKRDSYIFLLNNPIMEQERILIKVLHNETILYFYSFDHNINRFLKKI